MPESFDFTSPLTPEQLAYRKKLFTEYTQMAPEESTCQSCRAALENRCHYQFDAWNQKGNCLGNPRPGDL
jgi:hypothetical protein